MKFIFFINRWLEKIILVLLCSTMVICLTYSSFVRYFVENHFFTNLTHKAEELAVFCFIWMLYWGAVLATKEKAHFRIDAHLSLLPEKFQRWKYLPGDICWVIFNIFVLWQGIALVESSIEMPEYSLSLEIPMEVIYSIIPVTFFMMTFRLIQSYCSTDDEKNINEYHA
ncbi:TRAP transporter small permease [Amphritea sp. 1_MG-2023]|uniref:TRAP transporter small permease n=1 Tax=Amphritea sp. 1_MG-2023 TaxID=3062670 RepID=UPI0026E19D9C|nr:TRAP transporter small permease [Amphritea sp. 1_MG-2023]MDO6564390.1 TRAP transporter small permease [Amphritea sp. 1_MG-2023]